MAEFYIASLAHTQRQHRYITFFRADDRGYCWPLSWAGKYPRGRVMDNLGYYNNGCSTIAVPVAVVDDLAVSPVTGIIDGDAGPVVPNNAENWRTIIGAVIQKPAYSPQPEFKGARYKKRVRQ